MEFIQINDQLVATLVLCDMFFFKTTVHQLLFLKKILKRGKKKNSGQFRLFCFYSSFKVSGKKKCPKQTFRCLFLPRFLPLTFMQIGK